jgi:hypothetical protein
MSAPVGEPVSDRPCGPWSLWDMLTTKAKPFVDASFLIGQLGLAVLDKNVRGFQAETVEYVNGQIDALIPQLEALDCHFTIISAKRLKETINSPNVTPLQCSHYLTQLRDRLPDQLDSTFLISLSTSERALFEPAEPLFGNDVASKFPSAIFEVEECGKCYALGRFTASAFHSIRTLEAAIRAMSRCLGIPDPTRASDRNWGALLKAVRDEIDRRWPGSSSRMSGDGEFFDGAYAALAAMQNPWRNATMHLDQKYTPDEAGHVMDIVKGFMKKLASRMDEDGRPLA